MPTLGPYGKLASWILAHRRLVGGLLVVLTVVAAGLASRLQVDSNLLTLLPRHAPEIVALRKLHAEEGGANLVTLAFRSEDPEALDGFLDDLVVDLEALEEVQFAVHEIDPDLVRSVALLQLDETDVQELSVRTRGALALGPALNPIVTQRLLDMGPLTERIASSRLPTVLDADDGRGRVLIRPTGSSHDAPFAIKLMDAIESTLDEADPAASGVDLMWIGGSYRHNVEDRRGILEDLKAMTSVSFVLVVTIIALAFRSFRATIVVIIPLTIGTLLELATIWVLYGSITTYTSSGAAVLLGLGIDFAIHLVGRYREQRSRGLSLHDAICTAWDHTGPPCTTAALTSAAGFLALSVADFRGFSQLGVVLAVGLLMCLLVMLVALPVLLPWLDSGASGARPLLPRGIAPKESESTYRLAPLCLMVAVVATGLAASILPPDFEYDVSNLRRPGLSYQELSKEERALARESYSPVVVTMPDRRTLTETHRRVDTALQGDDYRHVARVVSIENVLPADQAARVAALQDLQSLLDNPNLRYLPPPFVKNLLVLRDWDGQALARADLPEPLLTLLGASTDDQHRLLLFPRGNMWDLREASAFGLEVSDLVGEAPAAGEYTALGALYRVIRSDMPFVAVVAMFLVLALSAIDLRRPIFIVGAGGTLIAGMVWAGVAVKLVGIELSIINIVGLPILLGIGVDVVIHLLHRLEEEGPGGVRRSLATTGVAALVSTLTTIGSFVSLTFAGNRGIQSLGMLVVIGLICVFVTTAAVLPVAWAAGWKVSGQAPSQRGAK